MSNVVSLKTHPARQPLEARLAAHARLFSEERRAPEDVFWLKENAEFLNILECTGQDAQAALAPYLPFYEELESKLSAFPQYYRFFLSICLDLEDLGLPGNKGETLCRFVARQGLPDAELSDLQRAEAMRLLERRGIHLPADGLIERLERFSGRAATFAIPNKKASYELTHIVFYLSEYGRRDPCLDDNALRSLTYAGLLAYLDQNYDLLAEICTALRFAGQPGKPIWEGAVMAALKSCRSGSQDQAGQFDDYHAYLVAAWMAEEVGHEGFGLRITPGNTRIGMAKPAARPLRGMSDAISDLQNPDWDAVKGAVHARLDEEGCMLLDAAERSTPVFAEFFEGFARSARP